MTGPFPLIILVLMNVIGEQRNQFSAGDSLEACFGSIV